MRIGVAREIKSDEHRVALTPAGAHELVRKGHDVLVEAGAGHGSAFADDAYEAVGARIASVDEELNIDSVGRYAGCVVVEVTRAAWPCSALDSLTGGDIAYPVAVAVAASGHGIALGPALQAFLHAIAATLISAGVRLIPLGQTDGQRVLAALQPVIRAAGERALATPLDDVGSAAFRADLAGMRHEAQHTRLFRS